LVKPEKRVAARQRLEQLIRAGSMRGQRLAGERELAAELGVGRKTLRAALTELEAAGLLDRRAGVGTYVAERQPARRRLKVARVAVIVQTHHPADGSWNYQGEMVRGLLEQAPSMAAECTVLALDRPEEAEVVRDDRQMCRFSGFVSCSVEGRELLCRLVALRRGPVVLLDHQYRDLPIVGVVDGSFEGARAVARHLLALGHRRIAFIDCPNRDAENPEKFAGYRAALADRGLPVDEQLVVIPPAPTEEAVLDEFVDREVGRLLGLPEPPTAIFGFDDNRALPALRALERRGLAVGRDFSLAGFGDSAARRGLCDRLTSCRIYPRRMGRAALHAALGTASPERGHTVIVPDRLYVRESTCPPSVGGDGGLRSRGEGAGPPRGQA
jgi:DNA-binding LacI/PurR family transcriptional regulator